MYKEVAATGKSDIDTPALQAALDELSIPVAGATTWEPPTLRLTGGVYCVNRPLRAGGANQKVPTIDGNQSCIRYVGPAVDRPLLWCGDHTSGSGRSRVPVIRDVFFDCDHRCRGILIQRLSPRPLLQNVYVYAPRQIGVDIVDCWSCNIDNVMVANAWGCAMRLWSWNAARATNIKLGGQACRHRVWGESQKVWDYEYQHGKAKAQQEFGADYVDDWPDPTETWIARYDGTPMQLTADQRALLVLSGGGSTIEGIGFESSKLIEYPLIWSGTGFTIQGLYLEDNLLRHSAIAVQGGYDVAAGRGFRVRDFTMSGTKQARSFLELRQRTYDVIVQNGAFHNALREAVIYAKDGQHYGPVVERVGSYNRWIDPDHEVIAAPGAEIFKPRSEMRKEAPPIPSYKEN